MIKIRSEFRNVGDAAYAMTHLSADTCTQRLAADQGVVTGISLQQQQIEQPSTGRQVY